MSDDFRITGAGTFDNELEIGVHDGWVVLDVEVMVSWRESHRVDLSPEQARQVAVALLNAADKLDPQATLATAVDVNLGPGGITITPAAGANPGHAPQPNG